VTSEQIIHYIKERKHVLNFNGEIIIFDHPTEDQLEGYFSQGAILIGYNGILLDSSNIEDKDLVNLYLHQYEDKFGVNKSNKKDEFTLFDISKLINERIPDLALLVDLTEACKTNEQLAFVAAGPLEDLFTKKYDIIQKEIDCAVRKSKAMRSALPYVWVSKESKAHFLLESLLLKYCS
jgi:hypothetical protein